MITPEIPENEAVRLRALYEYDILDTADESSFDELTRLAAHILDVPIALVSLVDESRQWCKSRHGLDTAEMAREISFCGHAVAQDSMLVVSNAREDERFHDNPMVNGGPHIRFYVGMPLRTPSGLMLGTLCALDHVPRVITNEEEELLQIVAQQVMAHMELRRHTRVLETQRMAIAAGQRALMAELAQRLELERKLSRTDPLTSLRNRRAFDELADYVLASAERSQQPFTLAYLDLDDFKALNDGWGHPAGDEALQLVAAVLLRSTRKTDVIARLGGDEFVLLLPETTQKAAQLLLGRIVSEVQEAMHERGWPATASVGAVTFGTPPSSLVVAVEHADAAMYRAKAAGKNRVVVEAG